MATHSSVLAWRIPGMGEPRGLLSLGSHRVGPDWSDLAAAAADRSPIIGLIGAYEPNKEVTVQSFPVPIRTCSGHHHSECCSFKRMGAQGSSLEVQWLALCASTAGVTGSIPGLGTKIHMSGGTAEKKKERKWRLKIPSLSENPLAVSSRVLDTASVSKII